MSAPIGHNSEAYGEAPVEAKWLGTADEVQFRFMDLHLGDWQSGTDDMACELEGAYIRFLVRLYQNGKPLRDEERYMATKMSLSVRVWRRLRAELIGSEKITLRSGFLTNKRFESERLKRAEQIRKQADAARDRWQRQRLSEAQNVETSAKLQPNLDETSPKILANASEKINEINDAPYSQPMPPFPVPYTHTVEEDSDPNGSGAEAPVPMTAREIIWDKGIAWLRDNESMMPEAKLRIRLGSWLKEYGDDETLEALRKAAKAKPVSPMTWIEKILRQDAAASAHVRRVGSKLEVFNGFKAELSTILKDRDLDRSLAKIAGRIPAYVRGVDLESKVRALAVEMIDQVEDQDRRYAKAASDKVGKPKTAGRDLLDMSTVPTNKPRPADEVQA